MLLVKFFLTYFDFWRTFFAFMIPITTMEVMQVVHYDQEGTTLDVVRSIVRFTLFVFANIVMIDYWFKLFGMLVVKNYVLRKGNEQLLNNIKSGIMIVSEDKKELKFANEAVKKLTHDLVSKIDNEKRTSKSSLVKNEVLSQSKKGERIYSKVDK